MIKVKIVSEEDRWDDDVNARRIFGLEYMITKFIEDNNIKDSQIISISGGGMPYSTHPRYRGSGDSPDGWAIITYIEEAGND